MSAVTAHGLATVEKITFCTASFPCAAHVRSARWIKQSPQKDYIKGNIKDAKVGQKPRVGEIIPARMEAGEPPREASIHAEPARWRGEEEKKKKQKKKNYPANQTCTCTS